MLVEQATRAFTSAVYQADLPAAQREAAAGQFLELAARLRGGGDPARAAIRSELGNRNGFRRNAAARLLAEMGDSSAADVLLALFRQAAPPLISPDVLAYLGTTAPLPESAWDYYPRARPAERAPLLTALLRQPGDRARDLLQQVMASGDPGLMLAAIKQVARWNEPERLRGIITNPPLPPAGMPAWVVPQIDLDAAFYLGLAGDRDAVAGLERAAGDSNANRAASAAVYLAWLAWPGGIGPTAKLLGGRDVNVVGKALDAALGLRSAELCRPLFRLAVRAPGTRAEPNLTQDAAHILEAITGITPVIPGPDADAGAIAQLTLNVIGSLDPALRYARGKPLTLAHLASELSSPHTGQVRSAAYNLRAMTGEDHGFDPDADLVANLRPIEAWRARAAQPGPVASGHWAFHGTALPDPEVRP